jgi:hypothetical protein
MATRGQPGAAPVQRRQQATNSGDGVTTSDESVAAAKVSTLFGGGGDWVLGEGLICEGRADPVKGILSFFFTI